MYCRENEFNACERLGNSISELLNDRDQEENLLSTDHTQLSANIRLKLKQLEREVKELDIKLDSISNSGAM